jgi:cytochrome b subunit of formate dehydrogenase
MIEHIRHGRPKGHSRAATAIRRFTTLNRVNHLLVALTFFGLTATGIPLVFSHQRWAAHLASVFGGIEAAGLWHRFFAILLIANFVLHFVGLAQSFRRRRCAWHDWAFGPNSLAPRWQDVKDCMGMFRWFFGLGRKPALDRWTYWEKFDYWAEVGGSMIIGGSGLLLWFPEIAARIVPGWTFNIAMIVHGYEALLAIGFIFTIHFFNAHIRPGTFPVDEVIFTGSMPEHELKETRPAEYKRLVESGTLESLRVPAPPASRRPLWVITAIVTVGIGVGLLALIIIGGLRLF